MKPTEEQIKLKNFMTNFRSETNSKLCIWNLDSKEECSKNIIAAHSIQRGKILSSIAENGKVSYLGFDPLSEELFGFELEGIKKFSTFTGFCKEHDKSIFHCIEDLPFQATQEQMDVYAYRAVARQLHAVMQEHEICSQGLKEFSTDPFMQFYFRSRYENASIDIKDDQQICAHIKSVINKKTSRKYKHIYFSFDKEFPIACSSRFLPTRKITNNQEYIRVEKLNILHENPAFKRTIIFNIFPESNKTHIIISIFNGSKIFQRDFDGLFESKNMALIQRTLTKVILNHVSNIAFRPSYINNCFNDEERGRIVDAFTNNVIDANSFSKERISLFR